eukprot:31082_5
MLSPKCRCCSSARALRPSCGTACSIGPKSLTNFDHTNPGVNFHPIGVPPQMRARAPVIPFHAL